MALPHIRTGDLNRQITLQSRSTTRDTAGEPQHTWSDVVTTLAKIEPLSGRELQLAQAINAEVSHKVTIRYRPGVTSAMRMSYQGRHFNIVSARDVEMAHVAIEMMCSEGMNDG